MYWTASQGPLVLGVQKSVSPRMSRRGQVTNRNQEIGEKGQERQLEQKSRVKKSLKVNGIVCPEGTPVVVTVIRQTPK